MGTSTLKLGFLESIGQVLALKTENLAGEHQAIWQVIKQADETTFYQLAPHLFVTDAKEEPLLVKEIEATPGGYKQFKALLKEDK
ncbi:hypothetical protein [Streptococcus equi]|uniref:hypothetical protein n=1 Tax=Streptococcus equi TaxID=1336 RepID=UPI0010C5A7FC|nr:lignostilbene-alpha,beta-dioxygenase [Streptococcus equi subsp. zooepidemicus]